MYAENILTQEEIDRVRAAHDGTRNIKQIEPVIANNANAKNTKTIRINNWNRPSSFYVLPELMFGKDDKNVKDVKRLAAKAARSFRKEDQKKHKKQLADLAKVIKDTDSARLRYWAGVVMIDMRFCGASGTGAYWAVASRFVNECALAEIKKRSDAWRNAGLGTFATLEAIQEAGLK